jgi:hypothetical protein
VSLVDEIAAEFEARPELRAALERPDRHAERARRQQPLATSQRPNRRQRRYRCGTGDFLCPNTLPARGLCPSCVERLEARVGKLERGRPRKVGPAAEKQPPAQTIDPADVFDAGDRTRVPAVERAAWMARWVHRVGGAVRRADAARVAGVHPEAGTMRGVLAAAEERRWIVRDAGGALRAGEVAP